MLDQSCLTPWNERSLFFAAIKVRKLDFGQLGQSYYQHVTHLPPKPDKDNVRRSVLSPKEVLRKATDELTT